MASVRKGPRSQYYHAYWRDSSGRAHCRSTRERIKKAAQQVADVWELASKRKKTARQIREVFNQIYRDAYGREVPSITFKAYTDRWLAEKRIETAEASASAYAATVK